MGEKIHITKLNDGSFKNATIPIYRIVQMTYKYAQIKAYSDLTRLTGKAFWLAN